MGGRIRGMTRVVILGEELRRMQKNVEYVRKA